MGDGSKAGKEVDQLREVKRRRRSEFRFRPECSESNKSKISAPECWEEENSSYSGPSCQNSLRAEPRCADLRRTVMNGRLVGRIGDSERYSGYRHGKLHLQIFRLRLQQEADLQSDEDKRTRPAEAAEVPENGQGNSSVNATIQRQMFFMQIFTCRM